MIEEEPIRIKTDDAAFPRNLEAMSLDTLNTYIGELSSEIERVKSEIQKKENLKGAAEKIFG